MKFSLSWLKDHLDTDWSAEQLAEKLTAIGLEVEALTDPAEALAPFTIARVLTAERHPQADKLQVLFVTVDPERDTSEVLSKYVPSFDPSFIGLRGNSDETTKAAREFKVFFQKVPNRDGTGYNVDHTAASYVLDTQGRLRLFVRHTQPVEEIVADLQQLL